MWGMIYVGGKGSLQPFAVSILSHLIKHKIIKVFLMLFFVLRYLKNYRGIAPRCSFLMKFPPPPYQKKIQIYIFRSFCVLKRIFATRYN